MTKRFSEIALVAKATWSEGARELYDAALEAFAAERTARASLGAQLLVARKASGLTQVELAVRSGIDQAEVSRIERGVANPTASTLIRLSSALGRRISLKPVSTG